MMVLERTRRFGLYRIEHKNNLCAPPVKSSTSLMSRLVELFNVVDQLVMTGETILVS